MQNFKLLFAMMLAVTTMQLRSASEGDMSTSTSTGVAIPRTRTSSKELMDEMNRQMIKRSACPKYQLAGIIETFQKNQIQPIMTNVKPGKHPGIQARYQALSRFTGQLSSCRATLEDRATTESIETVAQVVQNQLQGYRLNPGKIDIVVGSAHFLKIEKKCEQIISGSDR